LKRARWLPILAGSVWLGVTGWNFAHYWSGERVTREYECVSSRECLPPLDKPPSSWGGQHPECRNRFAFWPDGAPMQASEFSLGRVIANDILAERGLKTPEEVARDKWADEVRRKIWTCEWAQWMPIEKTNAIRRERIRVTTFALFPPILFLIGVGLVRRTLGTISTVVAKLIATVGALSIAVVIAMFIGEISDKFNGIVVGEFWDGSHKTVIFTPSFLDGPRLDVICALLIPIGIILWRRRPSPASKVVLACCLGIAAGFVPIVLQIFTWPFIRHSPDGVWAAAAVAVLAAVILSFSVTRRFIESDIPDPTARVVPHHIRRGLIRVYVALLIPWVAWFGYAAHEADISVNFAFSQLREFGRLSAMIEEAKTAATVEHARRELGLMAMTWGHAKTQVEINHNIDEAVERDTDRLTTAIYALLAGVAPPLLYPIFLWLLAGFRKSAPDANAVSKP
jgi:hypothetical protein